MSNSPKYTQRTAVEYAIQNLTNAPAEVIEKLQSISASLLKKATAERKPTPKQKENAGFKQDILDWMKPDTLYSITDVEKGVPTRTANSVAHARVSAMLTQLKDEGSLVREQVKGKVYFKLA